MVFADNFTVHINGVPHKVDVSKYGAQSTLNDFIRDQPSLHGTKWMCREGGCGVCSVTVSVGNQTYTVNSCLVLLYMCDGWSITTVEGLGSKEKGYHKIQQKLAEKNGSQCGFCSPGMVMNFYGALQSNPGMKVEDVEKTLDGNICRCTGYRAIMSAFKDCIDIEDIDKCASCPNKSLVPTTPSDYKFKSGEIWYQPTTLDQLNSLVKQHADDSPFLVSGHTSVGVYKTEIGGNVFISLQDVPELHATTKVISNKITSDLSSLKVGGACTLTSVEESCQSTSTVNGFKYLQQIGEHINQIASGHIRNIGSIAGNLMMKHTHNDFPSDVYILLEAAGAKLNIVDTADGSMQQLLPSQFLKADMKGKFLQEVEFSSQPNVQFVSYKIMPRYRNAHAYINMALSITLDSDGKITNKPSLVYGGISATVDHISAVEAYLVGKSLYSSDTMQSVIKMLDQLQFDDDVMSASVEFRKSLVKSLFFKAVLSLAGDKLKPSSALSSQLLTRPDVSNATQIYDTIPAEYPLTQPTAKLDAVKQTSGESKYIMDFPDMNGQLHAVFVKSTQADADIQSIDASEALKVPGVLRVLTADDIPGTNSLFVGMDAAYPKSALYLLAPKKVVHYGQPVAIIAAETVEAANSARDKVKVTYTNIKTPILNMDDAIKQKSFHMQFPSLKVGDADAAIKSADKVVSGSIDIGEQYHFYLEPQSALAVPEEGFIKLYSSTQIPTAVKQGAAKITGMLSNKVEVEIRRLGGGFGGKQGNSLFTSSAAALVAKLTNRPVSFLMSIEDNIQMLGRRQPFRLVYQAAVKDGKLTAVSGTMYENNGYDMYTGTIPMTGFWMENAYFCPNWNITLQSVKTNQPNHTYVRAPGSLSMTTIMEELVEHLAAESNILVEDFKYNNLFVSGQKTAAGEIIKETKIKDIYTNFKTRVKYDDLKLYVQEFNKNNKWRKQGIALMPLKYWQGFWPNNQYVVYILINGDNGSVTIQHGGVECGQGINTKAIQVAASTLGIDMSLIEVSPTSATINHHSSSTGGSVTSDMNCYAVLKGCETLTERLKPIKDQLSKAGKPTDWKTVIVTAYQLGVDLSSRYYYNTLDLGAKPGVMGRWHDVWGAAYSHVELDCLTGNYQVKTLDISYDIGTSYSPEIDVGQIEGAVVMALGCLLTEECKYDPKTGEMISKNTWEYKVPMAQDIPVSLNVELIKNNPNTKFPLRNKVVGEPPLLFSASILLALKDAINSMRADQKLPPIYNLHAPLTVEKIHSLCQLNTSQFNVEMK